MGTQKIIDLLNDSSDEESKFATKMQIWSFGLDVIDSQITNGKYKQGDTIKFETETIKSSLCDYSDTFILVTGNITVNVDNNTDVAAKNCAPFSELTEYRDSYSNTSGSLWQLKRDEVTDKNAINNSQSFK